MTTLCNSGWSPAGKQRRGCARAPTRSTRAPPRHRCRRPVAYKRRMSSLPLTCRMKARRNPARVSRHNLLRGGVSLRRFRCGCAGSYLPRGCFFSGLWSPLQTSFKSQTPQTPTVAGTRAILHLMTIELLAALTSHAMTPRIIMFIPGDIMSMFGQLSITPCLCTFCMITVT